MSILIKSIKFMKNDAAEKCEILWKYLNTEVK